MRLSNYLKTIFASLIILTFTTLPSLLSAQGTKAGWYVIGQNAKVAVLKTNAKDFSTKKKGNTIQAGECVYIFDNQNGVYYGFLPSGRLIALVGENILEPAKGDGMPVMINSTIKAGGRILVKNTYYWATSNSSGDNTVSVQLNNGLTEKVPLSNVTGVMKQYDDMLKGVSYMSVQ